MRRTLYIGLHEALPAVAAALILITAEAHAGVTDAVNWARLQGCGRPAQEALREDARLQAAADKVAAGLSLRAALTGAGYFASEATAVQVSGELNDARLAELLARRHCEDLTDSRMAEMGAMRRGRDVWVILASPLALSPSADSREIERKILGLVNAARAVGHRCGSKSYPPVPPLKLNANLSGAALSHSQEMAAYNEFEHKSHEGASPSARVMRAGYGAYRAVGENIAAGALGPDAVMQGWLNSPPHCQNIMDGDFEEIGIAYALPHRGNELVFWTQDFAAPAGR